jgi:hypothetical protein
MSSESTEGNEQQSRPLGQRLKHGIESKILVPVAVTVVSAAASYVIKKLPMILEEKVLPKLREKDAPEPVANVLKQISNSTGGASGASEAEDSNGDGRQEEDSPSSASATEEKSGSGKASLSNDEREEERRKREERRRERKRAVKAA